MVRVWIALAALFICFVIYALFIAPDMTQSDRCAPVPTNTEETAWRIVVLRT